MWFWMSARICRVSSLEKRKRRQISAADGHAHLHVPVEADAIGHAKCRRLAHVVQQRAPGQGERAARLQLLQQQQRVHPHVAFGMELRRLFDALHAHDFGQHLDQQIGLVEQFKGPSRAALGQHLGQLVAHPLAADGVDARGQAADGGVGGWDRWRS